MKKSLFILSAIAVTAAALVSCEKEQDVNIKEEPQSVPFEIVVGSIETKTANDGMGTNWVSGDQINLFHAVNGEASYVNDGAFSATADGASVSFTGTLASAPSSGTYDWFAVYPYSAGFDTPAGTATVTIPAAQTQVGNSSMAHLSGANCPVAGNKKNVAYDATPVIDIKHLTSVIKVHVTNKSAANITVEGVSFAAPININGAFSLDLTGDAPSLSGAGGSMTTALTVTSGSALAADESADFYLAIKYFTIAANSQISLTVSTDKGDQTLTTIVPSEYTFARGKIATLNFNFTNNPVTLAQFKYNDPDWLDAQSITKPASGAGTPLTASTQTVGEITLSSTDGSTPTRVWNKESSYDLRVYSGGGSFTLSSTDSYLISKIAVSESGVANSATFGADAANFAVNCGTKTGNTKNVSWAGLSQEVIFTVSNTVQIGTITVFYQAATASDHVVSLPVVEKGVAYNATSTTFTLRKVNVEDLIITSASDGYVSYSHVGSTLTVNMTANASSSPRNIVVNVASASAGFDEDITITQSGAPQTISSLSAGDTGISVTAVVQALSKKGYMISDGTGEIFVFLDGVPSVALGDNVTVAGDVEANSRALRIIPSGDATVNSSGSASYGSPTAYGKTEVDAWTVNAATRAPEYITLSGVAQGTYGIVVGGGSTENVQTYYAHSSLTSISKGDYVTVTGYAYNVIGSSPAELGIVATSITKNASVPALYFSDITGVAAAAAAGLTHSFSAYRVSGWTPSITDSPSWVTDPVMNAACTTLTYSVSKNSSTSERTGVIEITLTKDETSFVYYVNITQSGDVPTATFTFSTMGYSNGGAVTIVTSDDNSNTDITLTFAQGSNGSNAPKYYDTGSGVRMYNGNTLTITGGTITKVVLTASGNSYTTNATANTGTVSKSGAVETWTGSTSSLVLTAAQTSRTQTIVVTYTK